MQFTYNSYADMINTIIEHGYQISDYHNYIKSQYPCIIRHDVDMSLEKAVEFSEFESHILKDGKGIKSTYFILVSTDFYNVFSKQGKNKLKKIMSYGHEIGLHFDEQRYEDDDIKEHILYETSLLENVLEEKVKTVSMHRPSKKTLESDYEFEFIVNSYGKKFFNDFKYISDSRMYWRENPEEIISTNIFPALHVLTHPIWYTENYENTSEKLLKFISSAGIERYDFLDENFRNLEEFVRREEIE